MRSVFNGRYFRQLIIPSLIAGFIIQLNYCKSDYLAKGLIMVVADNYCRFIIGSVAFSIIINLLYILIGITYVRFLKKGSDIVKYDLLELSKYLYLYLIYFLLTPSDLSFIIISSGIPVIMYFQKKILVSIYKFKEFIDWRILLQGILFISFFNLAPRLLLLIKEPTFSILEFRDIVYASLIFIVPLIFFPKWNKIYLFMLLPFFYIPSLFNLFHYITYGNEMRESEYHAIWETSPAEIKGYLIMYFDMIGTLLIIGMIAIALFIIFGFKVKKVVKNNFFYSIIIAVIFSSVSLYKNSFRLNIPVSYINNYVHFNKDLGEIRKNFGERKLTKSDVPVCTNPYKSNETYVLIIGESLSKHHMSLYGYQRETNPLLKKIKNELYVFNDVIACNANTNAVLEKILTFASNEDRSAIFTKRSFIEYLKDAGYRTYWISNQQLFNKYSAIASIFGTQSDWYYFLNDTTNNVINFFDELLFKPLTVVLKQKFPKKFIILHLLGNHGNYSDRYPKSFDRFKTWDGIKMNEFNGEWHKMIKNTYDNAVLYNDSIIYEIIQKVKSLNQNSFVLYLSDHGEEVYDYRRFVGHSEANASIYMVEIPFILWVSDKYKIQNTEKVSHWPEYCNRKYQTDVMIHSMIDLLNLTSKEYLPKRSIFNPAFKFKQRIIVGNDFDELVKTKKSITD